MLVFRRIVSVFFPMPFFLAILIIWIMTIFEPFVMVEPPKKLLDQLRDVLRLKHYSYRTEQTYSGSQSYRGHLTFLKAIFKKGFKILGTPDECAIRCIVVE
jgi:hypothetical protein